MMERLEKLVGNSPYMVALLRTAHVLGIVRGFLAGMTLTVCVITLVWLFVTKP